MKLKIISDGTVRGTKIVNVETGEALENVVWARWEIDATRSITAEIALETIELEVIGGTVPVDK